MASLIVISGAPSSGKSTLIAMLNEIGYAVLPELAEIVINEGELLPWLPHARDGFQDSLFARQFEREEQFAAVSGSVFLDRGLFDGEAYSECEGLNNENLYRFISGQRYRLMLLLEPLPVFERTAVRRDDPALVARLTEALERTYRKHGITVVRVPVLPPQERLEFVLAEARKHCFVDSPERVEEALAVMERELQIADMQLQQQAEEKPSVSDSLWRTLRLAVNRLKFWQYTGVVLPLPYETQDSDRLYHYSTKTRAVVGALPARHPARAVLERIDEVYLERFSPGDDGSVRRPPHALVIAFKETYKCLLQHVMPQKEFYNYIREIHKQTQPSEATWRLYLSQS